MTISDNSPRITHLSWGRLEVERGQTFKDAKLFPGGAREWDWHETGTDHVPGIQPADVKELLEHKVTMVVLGKGMRGRLQVSPEALQMLEDAGVAFHILRVEEAVRRYNEFRESEAVGGLFHSTC